MDYSKLTDRWNEGDYFYRVKTFCYNECNMDDNAFPHALIGVFSEIVSDRERLNGEGFDFFARHGQATLATRLSLGIRRMPRANETCIFKAWVSEYADMRMFNECQLFSNTGELLVSCKLSSRTISTKTLKAIPPEDFAGTLPVLIREDSGAPECTKVSPEGEPAFICDYPVRYCDFDTHGNMNNSRYTQLVTNTLPVEYAKRIPREYVINHTRRVLPGDVIALYGEQGAELYRMFGFVNKQPCFAAELRY